MAGRIDARLQELGIELPEAAAPAASYVPFVRTGNVVFISGQGPFQDGKFQYLGRVPDDYSVEQAQQAARIVGLNIIAQMKAACEGDLDRMVRLVKLGGFVNSNPDFREQHLVVNGASDLMIEIFGDAGKHARFAVGAPTLPLGFSVEIDAVFEIA